MTWPDIVFGIFVGTVLVVHVSMIVWHARAWLRYARAVTLDRIATGELPQHYEKWPSWALANSTDLRQRASKHESELHLESLRREARRRYHIALLMMLMYFAVGVVILAVIVLLGPAFPSR